MLGEAFARLALLTLTTSGGGERVDEHPLRMVARPEMAPWREPRLRSLRCHLASMWVLLSVSQYVSVFFNSKSNVNVAMAGSCGRLGSLASRLLEGPGRPVALCPPARGSVSISALRTRAFRFCLPRDASLNTLLLDSRLESQKKPEAVRRPGPWPGTGRASDPDPRPRVPVAGFGRRHRPRRARRQRQVTPPARPERARLFLNETEEDREVPAAIIKHIFGGQKD